MDIKNIKLQILNTNIIYHNNIELLNKYYFKLNNKLIDISKNINYNIYFPIVNVNKIQYFIISDNHNIVNNIINHEGISYNLLKGINDIANDNYSIILNENNLCINYNFTIIDNTKNYTYYIYEYDINTKENIFITSNKLNIKKELVYDIIYYNISDNVYYLKTPSNYLQITNFISQKQIIILNKDYDYLLRIIDNISSDNYEFKIYKDNINYLYSIYDNNNLNYINLDNIETNFLFKINDINGSLIVKSNYNNKLVYTDYNLNILKINHKISYNILNYVQKKYINYLNNKINYLDYKNNNEILLINNIYNKITIIINSDNLEIGTNFEILLLKNLDLLLIEFDDNNKEETEINILNGVLDVYDINNNNNNNNKKTINFIDTTQKVIIKNSSLLKYSFIKLNCIDKINNKFVFTINSLLLNNSNNIKNIFI